MLFDRQKHVFSLSLNLHRAGPAARSHYFDIHIKITLESAALREFLPGISSLFSVR
jgi:hypothetical protein